MRLRTTLRSVAKTLDSSSSTIPQLSLAAATTSLVNFIRTNRIEGPLTVLTGAGVSTDSAIPDYRGEHGTYTLNPSYKPIFYQAFRDSDTARHRYWARSFLGFPPIVTTEPNPTHYALAALQQSSSPSLTDIKHLHLNDNHRHDAFVNTIITQNVDGLHQKAGSTNLLELHGTLHLVHCMQCGHQQDRASFQETLGAMNPDWQAYLDEHADTKLHTRMNADGDIELEEKTQEPSKNEKDHHHIQMHEHQDHPSSKQHLSFKRNNNSNTSDHAKTILDYHTFQYPTCAHCREGHYKPSVIFFGENIPKQIKQAAYDAVMGSSALIVMGTSLTTFSAFHLVQIARNAGIPIAMINRGPTRADKMAHLRLDQNTSLLMKGVVRELGLGDVQGEIRTRRPRLNVIGS
ncbi:hypothetical protein BGZ94_007385 [Podila epigama]|nr:hypothetical protein BGZ94_007385 [Podila epigama]